MFSALLNIVIPVFGVIGLGALYGRLRPGGALGYVNLANIELFTPALVFSALVKYPLALGDNLPLIGAGALVILLPGLLLSMLRLDGVERAALILPAMFRNTGNLGIPLMVLAFGEQQLGAIIILFVLSNLLHFSCNPSPRMKNRELVKTSGRWRDKLRNGGACGVMRLNQAV